ncbi:MAG: hypothetical protein JKY70_20705 [Mucilaginibacter sp.]|nr:hypothetical protein [Mucilaginibacter sp.]
MYYQAKYGENILNKEGEKFEKIMGISFNRFIYVLLLINLLEITGCRQIKRKIEYQYGNLTVTRIDDSYTSGFWFGTAESIKDREPNFRIHWAGNDGGFRVYLIFEKDHVEFLANTETLSL